MWDKEQDAQRRDIFRYNNLANSTLTIDGQYQTVDVYAKIDGFTDSPTFLSAFSDLTSVYKGQSVMSQNGQKMVLKVL